MLCSRQAPVCATYIAPKFWLQPTGVTLSEEPSIVDLHSILLVVVDADCNLAHRNYTALSRNKTNIGLQVIQLTRYGYSHIACVHQM